jgi:hypothetical protein
MNEKVTKSGEQINKGRRAFTAGVMDVAKGVLLGGGAISAVNNILLDGSQGQLRIVPIIPSRVDGKLIAVDKRTWMSKDARSFLDRNKDVLKFNTHTGVFSYVLENQLLEEKVPVNNESVKEIRVVVSGDGLTLGIYYLNEDRKSGTSISVYCKKTEVEVTDYTFP